MNATILLLSMMLNAEPALSPQQYINQAQAAQQRGELVQAARLGDACVQNHAGFAGCYQTAGLIYFQLAKTDANATQKMRTYLERYIELSPKDDSFSAKARHILKQAK